MHKPIIIGLTGFAGTGKDTVAQILQTHCGFAQIAFADALRNEICAAFEIDRHVLTRRDTKETPNEALAFSRCKNREFVVAIDAAFPGMGLHHPRSPRQIMQLWGTEYRRNRSHRNYWTLQLAAMVQDDQRRGIISHVISDVRFANEAQLVREMGGAIWQVNRPGCTANAAAHTSETDGSSFAPDRVINNRQDVQHLQSIVLGAWLMQSTKLAPEDLLRVGMAQLDSVNAEWINKFKHRMLAHARTVIERTKSY